MKRVWKRVDELAHRHLLLTMLLLVVVVTVPGFYRLDQIAADGKATAKQEASDNGDRIAAEAQLLQGLRHDVHCITHWINTSTAASRARQTVATKRLDLLFQALDAAEAARQKRARQVYHRAQRANRAYHLYVRHHPIPSLALACSVPHFRPPAVPPVTTKTKPTPTKTVTATVTRTLPPPPPRTITMHPAPRTVTRTVTVAPGHRKGHHHR